MQPFIRPILNLVIGRFAGSPLNRYRVSQTTDHVVGAELGAAWEFGTAWEFCTCMCSARTWSARLGIWDCMGFLRLHVLWHVFGRLAWPLVTNSHPQCGISGFSTSDWNLRKEPPVRGQHDSLRWAATCGNDFIACEFFPLLWRRSLHGRMHVPIKSRRQACDHKRTRGARLDESLLRGLPHDVKI